MPETLNSSSQLQTKKEAAEEQNSAEFEQKQTPQTAQTKERRVMFDENKPSYNPLLGMTPAKYSALISGSDQEHPLFVTDQYGFAKFHPENLPYQKGPATIQFDSDTGAWDVEGRRRALNNNIDKIAGEISAYSAALAPEYANSQDRNNAVKRTIAGGGELLGHTSTSFWSMFLNGGIGIMAQQRNMAESSWNIYKSEHKDDPAFVEAAMYLQKLQFNPKYEKTFYRENGEYAPDAFEFQKALAFSKKVQDEYGLSDGAKEVLKVYQDLCQKREEDERRMMIGVAFDETETGLAEWTNSKMEITQADEEESVMMTLGKFGGDVTGSLAAAWLVASTGAGAVGAVSGWLSKAKKVEQLAATATQLATTASKVGATSALASSISISEKLITVPVFLNQYNQIRTEALLSGKNINEANGIGFLAGAAEAGLEFVGFKIFKRFYRADGILTNYILRNIFPEALQEGAQTFAENVITQGFGVTQKQWTDIMYEVGMSMVAGAIGGGVFTFGRFRQEGAVAYLEKVSEDFRAGIKDLAIQSYDAIFNHAIEQETLEEESKNTKKTDLELSVERMRLREQYEKFTADQKKAHDEFIKAYKGLKTYYEQRIKRVNPDITQEQLNSGFRAIKIMTQLQKDGNILTDHYYAAVNTMISFLNKEGKLEQYNKKQIKQKLFEYGLTRKQAEALLSKDAIERNNAQWEVAETHIAKDLMSQGVPETEAKLSAKFTRALASETTLINPTITPLNFVRKMHAHVMNIQHAILYKMDLPEQFAPITDKFLPYGYVNSVDLPTALKFANKIADMILNKKPNKAEVQDVNEKLYGDKNIDPNLNRLRSLATVQAGMIQKIIENMPTNLNVDYSQRDFITMFLLNRFGLPWDEVFDIYGITLKGNRTNVDKFFNETMEQLYGKPTNENLKRLNKLSREMSGANAESDLTVAEKEDISKSTGFYSKEQNLIVLNNPKPGTAFHEYGHFALTTLVTNHLQLAQLGFLPDTSPLYGIYDRLLNKMAKEGKILTERQFQETVLDATMRVLEKGQDIDPNMTALITMLKAEGYKGYKRLVGSLLSSPQTEYENVAGGIKQPLSTKGKNAVKKEVSDILRGLTPINILNQAYHLRDLAFFKTGVNPQISSKANADNMVKQMGEEIRLFLKTIPVKDTDIFFEAVKKAEKMNNVLGMAAIAEQVSAQAIDFATDVICENEVKRDWSIEHYDEESKRLWRNGGVFFEADAAALPIEEIPGFRDNTTIFESLKKRWPGLPAILENIMNSLKRYLQSLEGASGEVSNHLRNIIMREVWGQSMAIQNFRETLADCANIYDEYWKKLTKEQKGIKAKEWRAKFHAVLGSSKYDAQTKQTPREKAGAFLKQELGEKAYKSWENALDLLYGNEEKYKSLSDNDPKKHLYKGIKNLLTEAGVMIDDIEFFFPMAVEDYNGLSQGFYGHAQTYNEIDKAKARLTKEYVLKHGVKDEKGEYHITKEQEAELQTIISDSINSQFQRNISDENKVTAFFKRTIFDYTKHPEMLVYYKDPFTTLDKYMDAAYRTIMMRNLIGKVQYDADKKPILKDFLNTSDQMASQGQIGQFLSQYNGVLNKEAVERFKVIMHDFVTRDSGNTGDLFSFIRDMNSFTTLGSIFSTLNQIQDIEFCFAMYGLKPTFKAIKDVLLDYESPNVTKLTDVGGETSNEMFRPGDTNPIQRITKEWVFSKTGFEWADRKVKEVAINAFNNWGRDVLKGNLEQFKNRKLNTKINDEIAMFGAIIDEIYPDPKELISSNNLTEEQIQEESQKVEDKKTQIAIDLIEGRQTPEVKYVQWYMLSKMQPMNAAAVPGAYNSAGPFGKLLYQFNTVAVRQMGFLGDYWRWKAKVGGKYYAALQMAKFAMFAMSVGIPKEAIEALLKGQELQAENIMLSPFHVFMINSYVISVAKREGLFKGATSAFTPKWGAVDNISRDAFRFIKGDEYKGFTWKSVPVIGMPVWYWALGGRDAAKKQDVALFHRKYVPGDSADRKTSASASLRFLEGKDND